MPNNLTPEAHHRGGSSGLTKTGWFPLHNPLSGEWHSLINNPVSGDWASQIIKNNPSALSI